MAHIWWLGFVLLMIIGSVIAMGIYMAVDEKKKEKEKSDKLSKMSYSERTRYYAEEELKRIPYNIRTCPSCSKKLTYLDSKNKIVNEWKLISEDVIKQNVVDDAYTLGGATTVFYKEKKNTIRSYQCPYCGFIRRE